MNSLEYAQPTLNLNPSELEIRRIGDQTEFIITGNRGAIIEGAIVSDSVLDFEPKRFKGAKTKIICKWQKNVHGLVAGQSKTFNATLITNAGEKELPITLVLDRFSILAQDKRITNAQDFFNFATGSPKEKEEAAKIFVSEDFIKLLEESDFAYLNAAKILQKDLNILRAMDNFFIIADLKEACSLKVETPRITLETAGKAPIIDKLRILKTNDGYVDARIMLYRNAPWLKLGRLELNSEDYENGATHVNYSVIPRLLDQNWDMERLIFVDALTKTDILATVDITLRRAPLFSAQITKKALLFDDSALLILESKLDSSIEVRIFCKEQHLRFERTAFVFKGRAEIPFSAKLSRLTDMQFAIRKIPILDLEIEIEAKSEVTGQRAKIVLPLTIGKW